MKPKDIFKAVSHLTNRHSNYPDCYIESTSDGCIAMNHPSDEIHVCGSLPVGFFPNGWWRVNGYALKRIRPYLEEKSTFVESLGDFKLKVSKADPFEDLKPVERPDMTIGFNGDFLASGIGACDAGQTILRLSTPQRAARLGDDDFLFLCMPVRLSI